MNKEEEKKMALNILKIGGVFVICLLVYLTVFRKQDDTTDTSNNVPVRVQETSNSSSTLANCVVCGKQCDYYHENIYMGHHVVIGGQMSSDVVCSLECDVKLKNRNNAILNNESH